MANSEEHRMAISRGVSRFYTILAAHRRCCGCGRKAALSAKRPRICRYCKHVEHDSCCWRGRN